MEWTSAAGSMLAGSGGAVCLWRCVASEDRARTLACLACVNFIKANCFDFDPEHASVGGPQKGYDRIHCGAECPDGCVGQSLQRSATNAWIR